MLIWLKGSPHQMQEKAEATITGRGEDLPPATIRQIPNQPGDGPGTQSRWERGRREDVIWLNAKVQDGVAGAAGECFWW